MQLPRYPLENLNS